MRKASVLSMRSVHVTVIALGFLSLSMSAQAFPFFKKKKKNTKATTETVKKDAYERILTEEKTDSARGPFVSLYRTGEKLLVELPPSSIGRDMLIGATVSSVSSPQFAELGTRAGSVTHIRFVEKDSSIVMQAVNSELLDALPSPKANQAEATNYRDLDLYAFPIKARNKKTGGILFDASSFFLRESKYFPVITKIAGPYRVDAELKPEWIKVTALKSFENNACIKMERNYVANMSGNSGNVAISNQPVSIGVEFTLALLPNEKMTPRLSDIRIGYFLTPKSVVNDGLIEHASFINRWRVEPKDTAAYFAGKLTEPVKPIVYYIDNNFPALWKKAIKNSVLRWNRAFERIGFKDVMQVKDFPTDDPNFDPDNFKYSCIRYLPTATENAMGPSWVDPRTGEIITATVLVYNDVINVINSWRFIQTSQLDPAARTLDMPDSIVAATLEYIVAHEVGHTLGLMHNMAASAAIPTDSLRSVDFTHKYGTTASIMDYARFNYVAQPTDKGVSLTPPFLGVYDEYAIDWGYRVFPRSKGFRDDIKPLQAMVAAHENDPMYRYGLQQSRYRYDPTAIEEDLGDDAVKSSTYGLKNLEYILHHFDEWIPDGADGVRKAKLYRQMVSQAYGYARNVYAVIGGIKLFQTTESSGLPRYQVVSKEKQREAALWLLQEAHKFGHRGIASIEDRLPQVNSHPYKTLANGIQEMALSATARLALSYYADSTSYSPLEYNEDIYNNVWGKTMTGNESLDDDDLAMQRIYVDRLSTNVNEIKQIGKVRSLRDDKKDVAFLGFGTGYGEPDTMWMETIDRTSEYIFHYALKLQKLLKERITTTRSPAIKSHYELMFARVQKYFNS